jgi:predicted phosphate transport protein (TIGR00153 family)
MFNFIPRQEKFFDLFKEAAQTVLEGAKTLKQMLDHYDHPEESWKKLTDLEHEGDRITHQILRMLNQTFITPIDREDMYALTTELDNVMDSIEAAASRMVLYKITQVPRQAQELGDIIVESAEHMVKAVFHMPKLEDIEFYCVEINGLENSADRIFRQAIAGLFDDAHSPMEVIKWRDIYEILEETTDRCEDVANVLESIALKNA